MHLQYFICYFNLYHYIQRNWRKHIGLQNCNKQKFQNLNWIQLNSKNKFAPKQYINIIL